MAEEVKVLWLLPVLCCIGWSLYNYTKLFGHRDELFIAKRSLFLVFGYTTSLILNMISILFTISANLYADADSPVRLSGYGISMITTYLTLYFLNVKTWLIYFQYQWTFYALQLKWQMIINTNVLLDAVNDSDQLNWFIRTRHKYGKLKFVYKAFGCIHCIFAIICCLVVSLFIPDSFELAVPGIISLSIITLITVIFYVVIIYKTPPFNDIYYIHTENKTIAPVLIIGLLIYVSLWATEATLYYENLNEYISRTLANVAQIELLLMWTVLLYISTIKIIHKNVHREELNIKNIPAIQKNIISSKLNNFTLENVASNPDTIDQFMKYLSRELLIHLSICPFIHVSITLSILQFCKQHAI